MFVRLVPSSSRPEVPALRAAMWALLPIYLPVRAVHTLESNGKLPQELIEARVGGCLGTMTLCASRIDMAVREIKAHNI